MKEDPTFTSEELAMETLEGRREELEELEAEEHELQIDGKTMLLYGARIEHHLGEEGEFRECFEDMLKENKITDLSSSLLGKVKPLLSSRKAGDVAYAVSYIVKQAYQKGVRDGLYEAMIQAFALSDRAAPSPAADDQEEEEIKE